MILVWGNYIKYYELSSTVTQLELRQDDRNAPVSVFPTIILCTGKFQLYIQEIGLDSMHSKDKIVKQYPLVNISSVEKLYGHDMDGIGSSLWAVRSLQGSLNL